MESSLSNRISWPMMSNAFLKAINTDFTILQLSSLVAIKLIKFVVALGQTIIFYESVLLLVQYYKFNNKI